MAILKYRDPTTQAWVPLPNIAGPQGPTGPTGPLGPTGATGPTGTVPTGMYLPLTGGTVTGNLTITGNLTAQTTTTLTGGAAMGGSKVTAVGDGTTTTDAATYGQLTTRTPPIIVLSATGPVPPGTAAGTVIIRTA